MNETFVQGLVLSVIGMSMVFAGLAALWALIAVLGRLRLPSSWEKPGKVRLAQSKRSAGEPDTLPTADELAAIAVALALLRAEGEAEAGLRWRLPPLLTRWVAVGYGRHLQSWQPPRSRRSDD